MRILYDIYSCVWYVHTHQGSNNLDCTKAYFCVTKTMKALKPSYSTDSHVRTSDACMDKQGGWVLKRKQTSFTLHAKKCPQGLLTGAI